MDNDPDPTEFFDFRAFHTELRLRMPVLRWTLLVFSPVLLGWSLFDYLLVPRLWLPFLGVRLTGAVIGAVAAFVVSLGGLAYRTWEALWIIAFVYCTSVAVMMPFVGQGNLFRFVVGYIVVIIAVGVFPEWPVRWGLSVIAASLAVTALIFFSRWDPLAAPIDDVIASSFVVLTFSAVSVVIASYKYSLARNDYVRRLQLSTVVKRETEARHDLARTSSDLKEALEKLQELDRLKSRFFANISHELRTPLTLILAPVEELAQIVNDRDQKQQLRVIRNNAERLLGLINDLLDLSRLDAGGLRLNLAEMDIRPIAATVHENSLPAALAKSTTFDLIADAPRESIWGDAHRLEIVITNLVSNAIKFTPPGGRILLRVYDDDFGVHVQVEDNGPGIPSEDLPRVFERFFQVNPSDRRREGGVGIGLALAKELIELHGGRIDVESEPGVRTTFSVFLPFGQTHINPEVIERRQQYDQESALGRRVDDRGSSLSSDELDVPDIETGSIETAESVIFEHARRAKIVLAEDHEEVREFVKALLEPDYEVRVARNGREAWQLIRQDLPDLVVSDVMMPEMSGTELCQVIKADPGLRTTPVILLTARVGSEATLEAYARGADDFVAKPFHPRVLMARIRAQLKLRALSLQLAKHEKLAAVGTLAAGILHEVRNPINAILNASRLLAEGSVKPEVSEQLIGVISDGARRIEDIAAALDSHVRPAEGGVTWCCDVQEGLDATIRLMGHRLEGVVVHRDYRGGRLAEAPAGPINQVFLNLIDNAVNAGAITIWVSVEQRDDVLRVRIADNGHGVSLEDSERIFQPFFSKRKGGSGTGLGLYLSRKIVEEHGGTLCLERQGGEGATFLMELPAVGSPV